MQRLISEVEPGVVVTRTATMRHRLTASLARPRFNAMLLGAFASIALILAAVGVYSVIAAVVRQRTPEIGVRIALGAQTGDVRRMVLRNGLVLAGSGVGAGLIISIAATRLLGAELYGVTPTDPRTMVAASVILVVVSVVACWLPARAATRVDPLIALKAD